MSESLHDMLQLVCVVLLLCTHLPSVDRADGSENEDDSDVRLCTKTIVLYGKGEQWIPTQKNEEGLVFGGRQVGQRLHEICVRQGPGSPEGQV